MLGQRNITSLSMAAYEEDLEARVLAALARADAAEASGAAAHARAASLQKRLDANAHAAQRLLRVRFRRAPPAAISMHRATPVKWELDVTDDQGTTVPAVDVEVRCRVDGAPHPVTTTRMKERWLCSAPAAAFTDRCRVVAEAWVAGRRAGPLDVLGVAAEVRVVAGSGDDAPTFEAIRDLSFGDIQLEVVEEFGDACGSHLWNAGLVLASYISTLDETKLPDISDGGLFVEVGSGVGAASLALAARGCSGDVTDQGRVLALLERNIERNGAGELIRAVAWDVVRDEVPAWNVLGSWNVLVAADVLYSAEAAASLPGVVAALPDLREIWLAHTHRGAGDRLDATIEALSATFPVADVVERVRDTRVVVLRRK